MYERSSWSAIQRLGHTQATAGVILSKRPRSAALPSRSSILCASACEKGTFRSQKRKCPARESLDLTASIEPVEPLPVSFCYGQSRRQICSGGKELRWKRI